MENKKIWLGMLVMLLVFGMTVVGCASFTTKQYGIEGEDTIALNLTRDPNVGALFITHVNGVATGATFSPSVYGIIGGATVYVNPIYVRLDGNPIIFTILCPVRTGTDSNGNPVIQYKTTELRLTRLADVKAGDVLTLRWMYQTQTFAFMDATGNIVQQTIPEFN